jgi:hypothetical protein
MDINTFAVENDLYASFIEGRDVKLSRDVLPYFCKWGFKESVTENGRFDWEMGTPWEEWTEEAVNKLTDEDKEVLGDLAIEYAKYCFEQYQSAL